MPEGQRISTKLAAFSLPKPIRRRSGLEREMLAAEVLIV